MLAGSSGVIGGTGVPLSSSPGVGGGVGVGVGVGVSVSVGAGPAPLAADFLLFSLQPLQLVSASKTSVIKIVVNESEGILVLVDLVLIVKSCYAASRCSA